MNNLQNPTLPVQQDPVEIDRAIIDLQGVLDSGLPWLTHPYGRAYRNIDNSNKKRSNYPQVYLGVDRNQAKYFTVTPDNDKQGQSFFLVDKEVLTGQQQGSYGFLNYNVAIIFSVNLELINESLLQTDLFTANLVKQVRSVLRNNLGAFYQAKVINIDYRPEEVFRGLSVELETIEKAPLQHFRVNIKLVMQEECD